MPKKIKSPSAKLRLKKTHIKFILSRVKSKENKLAIQFATLFRGREDAWGRLRGGCVREELNKSHYLRHLNGEESLGIYPVLDDGNCYFALFDLDFRSDPNAKKRAKKEARRLYIKLSQIGFKPMLEISKSGLVHVWVLFSEPVPARKVRVIFRTIANMLNLPIRDGHVEVFPKQDSITPPGVGHYINLPYFGTLTREPENRVMVDFKYFRPLGFEKYLKIARENRTSRETLDNAYNKLVPKTSHTWADRKEMIIEILSGNWSEGQRQNLALYFAGFARKHNISWADTREIILGAASNCGDDETRQRLDAIKSTYNKKLKDASIKGYTGLQEILSSDKLKELTELVKSRQYTNYDLKPTPLRDFMGYEPPTIRWIVDKMIVEGSLVLLVGKPKLGKSIFALNIGLSVAQGELFLQNATTRGKVLYLALEDRPRLINKRLWQILQSREDIDIDFICKPVLLDSQEQRDSLKALIEERDYKLVIIDPLIESYNAADENNANDMARVLRPIREIVQSTSCSCLVIHHTRKSEGISGEVIRGSSAILGAVDGAILLKEIRGQGKNISIETIIRDAESGELKEAELKGDLRWELKGKYPDIQKLTTNERIKNQLKSGKKGIRGISKSLGLEYEATKKALQTMVEEGVVIRLPQGKNRKAGNLYMLASQISQEKLPREKSNDSGKLYDKHELLGKLKVAVRNKRLRQRNSHSEHH
ncbi:MAG: AAA family ATPase [Deltaproteobacteria bacterium]